MIKMKKLVESQVESVTKDIVVDDNCDRKETSMTYYAQKLIQDKQKKKVEEAHLDSAKETLTPTPEKIEESYDVKSRKELTEVIEKLKENNYDWKIRRSKKEGYRYLITTKKNLKEGLKESSKDVNQKNTFELNFKEKMYYIDVMAEDDDVRNDLIKSAHNNQRWLITTAKKYDIYNELKNKEFDYILVINGQPYDALTKEFVHEMFIECDTLNEQTNESYNGEGFCTVFPINDKGEPLDEPLPKDFRHYEDAEAYQKELEQKGIKSTIECQENGWIDEGLNEQLNKKNAEKLFNFLGLKSNVEYIILSTSTEGRPIDNEDAYNKAIEFMKENGIKIEGMWNNEPQPSSYILEMSVDEAKGKSKDLCQKEFIEFKFSDKSHFSSQVWRTVDKKYSDYKKRDESSSKVAVGEPAKGLKFYSIAINSEGEELPFSFGVYKNEKTDIFKQINESCNDKGCKHNPEEEKKFVGLNESTNDYGKEYYEVEEKDYYENMLKNFNWEDEVEYQFPSLTRDDLKRLMKYDLEIIGKMKNGESKEKDILIGGKLEDIVNYAGEELSYALHPDFLYHKGEFDRDLLESIKLKEDGEKLNRPLATRMGKLLLPSKTKKPTKYVYEIYWFDNNKQDGDPIFKKFYSKKQQHQWYEQHKNDEDKFGMFELDGYNVNEELKERPQGPNRRDEWKPRSMSDGPAKMIDESINEDEEDNEIEKDNEEVEMKEPLEIDINLDNNSLDSFIAIALQGEWKKVEEYKSYIITLEAMKEKVENDEDVERYDNTIQLFNNIIDDTMTNIGLLTSGVNGDFEDIDDDLDDLDDFDYGKEPFDESLKESKSELAIKYWVDEEHRDKGISELYFGEIKDLEDAKHIADKLFDEYASVEVVKNVDTEDEEVLYGRYPEDEDTFDEDDIKFNDNSLEEKKKTEYIKLNQYDNVVNVPKEVFGDFEQLKKEAIYNGVKVKEDKDFYSLIGDFDDIDFLLNGFGTSLDEVLGYKKGE